MSFQYLTMREGFKDPVFHSSPKPMTHLEVLRARAEADEDLVEIWANAFDKEQSLATHVPGSGTARLAAARAVATRVRRERGECLVERLVAKGWNS